MPNATPTRTERLRRHLDEALATEATKIAKAHEERTFKKNAAIATLNAANNNALAEYSRAIQAANAEEHEAIARARAEFLDQAAAFPD